jgi:hypothetical protein
MRHFCAKNHASTPLNCRRHSVTFSATLSKGESQVRKIFSALVVVSFVSASASAAFFQDRAVSDRDGTSNIAAPNGPYSMRPDGLGALIVGSGWDSNSLLWRAAMEFDVSSVSGTVSSATISFTREIVSNPPAGYRVHGYIGDGVVAASDLSVNNQLGPTYSTNSAPVVDVTAYIASLVSAHRNFAGFTFSGFPGGSGMAIRSSEPFIDAPLLSITYTVPEPVSIVGVIGASPLLSRRRRG